ncbi:DUF6153 family protein [Paeniglutamicibacter gangotriensis]|uniref:Uncharacterized protein n=1 Tax=Paeniglutamicibacter gangotriensis Lz1y TaxID=1276920 RepID=M7MNW4_9MICC|nr:DUF6153 family protein [Paeniglutamicibacter gangotriensis]EMQ96640.1 hypothetical protein ADIAG_04064 [Paeniglutamicibacter gangotriensis Lz1y]
MNKRRAILPSVIRPAFLMVALILGLLAMHILGVDHQVPHATHGSPVTVTEQAGTPDSSRDLTHLSAPAQHAPVDDSNASFAGDSLGGMESAVLGMCILALSLGGIFLHLVSRAFRPVPGRGLAAPPVTWFPPSRARTTPSLVQLSISRT